MRRFKNALRVLALHEPNGATGLVAAGRYVADVEAEGNVLIGAVPCGRHHGTYDRKTGAVNECPHRCSQQCPHCGAAL